VQVRPCACAVSTVHSRGRSLIGGFSALRNQSHFPSNQVSELAFDPNSFWRAVIQILYSTEPLQRWQHSSCTVHCISYALEK
jgi:hypothetical protein